MLATGRLKEHPHPLEWEETVAHMSLTADGDRVIFWLLSRNASGMHRNIPRVKFCCVAPRPMNLVPLAVSPSEGRLHNRLGNTAAAQFPSLSPIYEPRTRRF